MEAFMFKHADSLLPDEQPYALQTAGSLLLTPLDDVFAEYDGLRKSDGDILISSSDDNAAYQASELAYEALLGRPQVPFSDAIRSQQKECDTSEASVPLVSSSAATSSDSGDEEYRPSSRGSAAKSRCRGPVGVKKSVRGRKGERQSQSKLQELTVPQFTSDRPSMSGLLQPFDVIKNYGMAGTVSLQQLNDRIKNSCAMH